LNVSLGYALSSEEQKPSALVKQAVKAEAAGFEFAPISDHFHPWLDVQGNSSFVWSVLGGIAQATSRIRIGTGVTCPIKRVHPAIIAQAAATTADMMPGRFFLGLGSGENLNEHITGGRWPPVDQRQEMLSEAVEIIRELWNGHQVDYRGRYFEVENARLYTLPEKLPPIYLAASAPAAAELASRIGDGLISTSPNAELVQAFGGPMQARPRYGEASVCWAATEDEGLDTAFRYWPTSALSGQFKQEMALPAFFEQACQTVRREDVKKEVVCGPDPEKHIAEIQRYIDAGFDHVYVHQIGPDQDGFFNFYEREVLPDLGRVKAA